MGLFDSDDGDSGGGDVVAMRQTKAERTAIEKRLKDQGDDSILAMKAPHPTHQLIESGTGKIGGAPRRLAIVPSAWVKDAKVASGWRYRMQPGDRVIDIAYTFLGDAAWYPPASGKLGGINQINRLNGDVPAIATGHQERLMPGQLLAMPKEAVATADKLGAFAVPDKPGARPDERVAKAVTAPAKKATGWWSTVPVWAKALGTVAVLGTGLAVGGVFTAGEEKSKP
jgi:hypothetical protein